MCRQISDHHTLKNWPCNILWRGIFIRLCFCFVDDPAKPLICRINGTVVHLKTQPNLGRGGKYIHVCMLDCCTQDVSKPKIQKSIKSMYSAHVFTHTYLIQVLLHQWPKASSLKIWRKITLVSCSQFLFFFHVLFCLSAALAQTCDKFSLPNAQQ